MHLPGYAFKTVNELSGKVHFNEFGHPVPIEYWNIKPDFFKLGLPIVAHLKSNYKGRRIGIRFISLSSHKTRASKEIIDHILQYGHDRYDKQRHHEGYEEESEFGIFLLEIDVEQETGILGTEQIIHAMNSFYEYSIPPSRVDIAIVYDLGFFKRSKVKYKGKVETYHTFKESLPKTESILEIIHFE